MFESKFITTNDIRLHYLESNGIEHPVILMHGLTANAHSFGGILNDGLEHHLYVIDLRGRGESDKPDIGYSMQDHAKDIIGFMDNLNIKKAILGGHSFGALLSIYIAFHHPERVEKLILIDAAARMHPDTKDMIAPSMARLNKQWVNLDDYFNSIKNAPYLMGHWDKDVEKYYRADVQVIDENTVKTKSNLQHITEAVTDVFTIGIKWLEYISGVSQPSILINAPGMYTEKGAILPRENAMETVNLMKNCTYIEVPGNHLTMLFGDGASAIKIAIDEFLK